MSNKAEHRTLGLFRYCHNLYSKKHHGQTNSDNSEKNFSNDVQLLEKLVSEVKLKPGRKLDYEILDEGIESSVPKKIERDKISHEDYRNELSTRLKKFLPCSKWRTASVEYAHLYRMMAVSSLERGNQPVAVQLLTESHAIILQQQILHRFLKTKVRQKYLAVNLEMGLRPVHMEFAPKSTMQFDSMKKKLTQMPEEWYMIQITVRYNEPDYQKANGTIAERTCPLHLTVFPTGPSATDPFCITLPDPNNQNYDGMRELVTILKTNKADLETYYASNAFYWKMRDKQNNKLKGAVTELEHGWLREWRILLMADPLNSTGCVKEMRDMIDKLIADDSSIVPITESARWLLRKIAASSCFLSKIEIARAVHYVLGDNHKLASNVILSIYGKLKNVNEFREEKRKTLVIIVDETVDHVPFESMDILKNHPVTRFPSFHIAYAMFKEHEDTIVNGCKIVKRRDKFGSFIVNPDRNLNKLQKRMKLFLNYWLPDWEGNYGVAPTETSYEQVLVNRDILMYAGHGNGIQYLPGEKIEKLRVQSCVLLFGCSSVKLFPVGGKFPPHGVSNQYLIACSPCILGMLWEVTDGDIDRMTSTFMSNWIPSNAERPWSSVDLNKWIDGILKFTTTTTELTHEPEMLRAVAKSKQICTQHMTAAAIVVRGLPLRFES